MKDWSLYSCTWAYHYTAR